MPYLFVLQAVIAVDPSSNDWGGGGGGGGLITSKGGGLLRSNLSLGDTLLRGAGYFVTGPNLFNSLEVSPNSCS